MRLSCPIEEVAMYVMEEVGGHDWLVRHVQRLAMTEPPHPFLWSWTSWDVTNKRNSPNHSAGHKTMHDLYHPTIWWSMKLHLTMTLMYIPNANPITEGFSGYLQSINRLRVYIHTHRRVGLVLVVENHHLHGKWPGTGSFSWTPKPVRILPRVRDSRMMGTFDLCFRLCPSLTFTRPTSIIKDMS